MSDVKHHPDAESTRLREGLIRVMKLGIEAHRNDASKWDPLYQWFSDELGIGDGRRNGPVIGKLVTDQRQIGNRCDEMAKYSPAYAAISVLEEVTPDQMLGAMRKRGRLPSLKAAVFFRGITPDRLVIFDE